MRRKALAVTLLLLGLVAAAFAQQQAILRVPKSDLGATEETTFVLQSQVAEVAVRLAVTDRSGKPVAGLSRDDLQIWTTASLQPSPSSAAKTNCRCGSPW
jgi:hypothetical protein